MTKNQNQDKHASSPEVFNPVGDHSGRLEAAMGVHQCVCVCLCLFFISMTEAALADRRASRGWRSAWTGCSTTEASVGTKIKGGGGGIVFTHL